tara:strand:- start:384 stop:1520 length:1137 start_codon:yes stop_codon:yes gene_type:complete
MPLSKISTNQIADDAVTGAKIENNPTIAGNLTVSGDFVPSTSLNTENILINGDMVVAQRASSSTSNGIQTVDRWSWHGSQVAITQSQQSTATSDAPYQHGFSQFTRAEVTSSSTNDASYAQLTQQIEARNILRSGWNYKSSSSYLTYSFWARSSLAGTYHSFLFTTDMSPNKIRTQTFVLQANTWTKVSLTFNGDSSLVIDNNTGPGMIVYIVPYYGPSFTGSNANTSSWYAVAGQDYTIDFLQNWGSTNGRTFDVTGCQLEVGQSATPYKHETPDENHRRCFRYFYKPNTTNNFMGNLMAPDGNANDFIGSVNFPVPMRATPAYSGTPVENGTVDGLGGYISYDTNAVCLSFIRMTNNGNAARRGLNVRGQVDAEFP